jgi:hypothetical protein
VEVTGIDKRFSLLFYMGEKYYSAGTLSEKNQNKKFLNVEMEWKTINLKNC